MSLRLEGQDTLGVLTRDGEIVEELVFESFEVELNIDVEETMYVGETDPRFREVHRGATLTVSGHADGSGAQGVVAYFQAVEDRARRKSVGMKLNATSVLLWPNGDQRTAQFNDIYVQSPSYRIRGKDLVEFSFTGRVPKVDFE